MSTTTAATSTSCAATSPWATPRFTQEGLFPAGANSRNVAVGDFNGDGKLDAAVANNGTNTVSVFLRNATNNGMTAATNITVAPAGPPAPKPTGIVVADFNNDGKQDFAVSLYGINKVATFLGTGNGTTFNADTGSPIDFVSGNPNALGLGDFDLDGRKDLAVTLDTGNEVTILRRNTNLQGFTKESPNPITSPAHGLSAPNAIGVADFDGDTRPDLAVTSRATATVRFFKNTTTIPAPINTALPQVSGTPQVGSQLSCTQGTWEGLPTSFTYVWDRAPRATTSPTDPSWVQINGARRDDLHRAGGRRRRARALPRRRDEHLRLGRGAQRLQAHRLRPARQRPPAGDDGRRRHRADTCLRPRRVDEQPGA